MEAFQNIEEQTFDGMPVEEVGTVMELYGKIHRRSTDRPEIAEKEWTACHTVLYD